MSNFRNIYRQHNGRKNNNRNKYNNDGNDGGHWRQQNHFNDLFKSGKNDKIAAYRDTVTFFTKKAPFDYVIPRPFYYTFESLDADDREITPILGNGEKMKVVVENIDTFDFTQRFISEGSNPSEIMILNMASKHMPGGGVRNGAAAQEEELFRRSNYFLHLPIDLYELETGDFIYSRNLIVIKDTDYNMLPSRFNCNALCVAALKNPQLNDDGTYRDPRHYNIMYNKIHGIFKIAYRNGQKHLVLGSIGCGAYGNDAKIVASIFRDVIKKFDGCFKTVAFAVLCGRNTYNFDQFKDQVENGFKIDTASKKK